MSYYLSIYVCYCCTLYVCYLSLSLSLSLSIYIYIYIMERSGRRTVTHAAESVKMETTAGVWQQSGFICSAADNFQHLQNPHAHA